VLRLLEHSMLSFNPKEISQSLRVLRLLEHLMLPFALMYVSSQSTIQKHQSFSLLCMPKYSKALIQDPGS
jgi:hypothetical protein